MQRDVCKKVRIGIKGTKGRRVLSELNRRLLEDIFHFQRNRTEIDVKPHSKEWPSIHMQRKVPLALYSEGLPTKEVKIYVKVKEIRKSEIL